MININDSIRDTVNSLMGSSYTEKEALELATEAKSSYSAFQRFEESRKRKANKEFYLAARQLSFI